MSREPSTPGVAQVGLIALFVTALVTAQLTASKVLAIPLPGGLEFPVTGDLLLPGAAVAYALTFLASDCYTELYGKRAAQVVVNVAFAANFVLLALVWSTIWLPGHPSGVDPALFETVLGAGTNVVFASLAAYVVSQNYDVIAFDWLRERTDGSALWLRNVGSTATSQAIDTVIFVSLAFYVLPRALGLGEVLPGQLVLAMIAGQYLLKLAVALVDTPFVYAIVGAVRRRRAGEPVLGAASRHLR